MGAASVISAGIGMIGANQAKKRAQGELNNAKRERDRLNSELQALEDSRQPIVNPYENVTDTSGNISNTYANLGVATQAAEFQAEHVRYIKSYGCFRWWRNCFSSSRFSKQKTNIS